MTSPLEQKKLKITGPVVVTANRAIDGVVLYRSAEGDWATELNRAAVATTPAAAKDLLTAAAADGLRAVGPYVAPVKLQADGAVSPGNLRELIRAGGPTITLPFAAGHKNIAAAGHKNIAREQPARV